MTAEERKLMEAELERLRNQQAMRYEDKHKDGAYETSDRIAYLEKKLKS